LYIYLHHPLLGRFPLATNETYTNKTTNEKKTEDCIKTMNNIKITEKEEHIKKFNSIMQQKINCEEKLQLTH
jgi:hypothetical protein